ncbi:peptidase [Actinoplanes ianthinogenes]|uniref:Peptidase n=1 Tax=Actinoplanes ianthinogenes TaxID=122358 RepID=A0ABN6CA32_9ACTN|nr:alpha/beta hydrolase [Actinoplanes ianthinogenes]BCJ41349.1 peptidase [Actinoplanes ianthinogenes]GGR56260.1 peptidase [Actinoplanes ianthinogenes]
MRLMALVTTVLVAAAPAVAHAAPARAALDWGECTEVIPNITPDPLVTCGWLTLPVDWARPHGATFRMAVAKRAAPDPQRRVGTLVFGPGGPGDSGVYRVRQGTRFSPEQRDRFDIVSFDPRTVARSAAPTCAPEADDPPVILDGPAAFAAAISSNRAYWARCRASSPVFGNADSVTIARDLDALRRALGEPRLTFHGSSYGTLLGQMYAERFPDRVRAIVLESAFDHDLPLTEYVRSEAAASQDALDEFVAWCDRVTTAECELHGTDVRDTWRSIVKRAGEGGYPGSTTFEIAAIPMALTPQWPTLATTIRRLADGWVPPKPDLGVASGVFCADFPVRVRDFQAYRKLLDVAAKAAPDVPYGAGLLAVRTCLGWPQPIANPPHRLSVHTRTPLLVFNAVHDPRTPYAWARHVAAELGPSGRLVTYRGAGHGQYRATACTTSVIDRYLIDLTVPPPGASCPAAD